MPTNTTLVAIHPADSVEALFASHRTSSQTVYLATLLTTVAALCTAAITRVDLTVRAPATLASALGRQTVRSLIDGVVDRMSIAVGNRVRQGDTLVVLAADAEERGRAAAVNALDEQRRRRSDLRILLALSFDDTSLTQRNARALLLERSRAAAATVMVEWRQASIQVMRAERVRDRLRELGKRGFAVPAEIESADFDVMRAIEERALTLERRRTTWAEELADAEQQQANLQRDVSARVREHATRVITAPVAGTVEEIMPLSRGGVMRAGDVIATISPEGALVADALVAPRDVAYLRPGMSARLLVEGYDVQEWGAADAIVTSVARDYILSDGHPVFRVRLHPLRPVLHRANGTAAPLGKGLRCQVRFLIGRRRIAELAGRRAREWLDPVAVEVR
jgi:multidrug resistance efflux pump